MLNAVQTIRLQPRILRNYDPVTPYFGNILTATRNPTENPFLHLHNECNLFTEPPQQYTMLSDVIMAGDILFGIQLN